MNHSPDDAPIVGGRYSGLYRFVARRVTSLQAGYLEDASRSVASLARLRRALNSAPGASPDVWAETLRGMPHEYVGDDLNVSPAEYAVHSSLCLYAIHQQGRTEGMHVERVSLGRAASRLARTTGNEAAVSRRFQALATAVDLPETLHHGRGLITQFRAEKIRLDYGLLAVDLVYLQHGSAAADRVRLRWGRDYYFTDHDANGPATSERETASDTSGEEQ